jgi:hypothetical protein
MSLGDDYSDGQTRTRMPERSELPPRRGRGGGRSSRGLVTGVGVIVLLIAAIAFANRDGEDAPPADKSSAAAPTAPTGERPVTGKAAGIPTGYAHDQQGAQSAAANYAVALGSSDMFSSARRHEIVQTIAAPSAVDRLQEGFDADYSAEFLKNVGLEEDGSAPDGSTFVNRTLPIGTKVTSFESTRATVEVWCQGLFGIAGNSSTTPVTSSWFTVTIKLQWADDWKVLETAQKTGPTPVHGDNPVSGAEEISKAVEEYGGFTYAR